MKAGDGEEMTYLDEDERLGTFFRFPKNSILKPYILSKAGFFYMKQSDSIVCAFCGANTDRQKLIDNPLLNHYKYSSKCSSLSFGIPDDSCKKISDKEIEEEEQGYDICGGMERNEKKKTLLDIIRNIFCKF